MVVPLFLNVRTMGLLDTYFALIFPYAAIGIPLSVLILSDFFRSVPVEIEESAVIDGATTSRVFWSIMLPIVLVYLFLNKKFIEGIALGAVKQ